MNDFAAHADDGVAPSKGRQHVAQRVGAGDRVELVAAFDQTRRRRDVVVGAKRDDEDVRVEGAGVGHDAPGRRVDGAHVACTNRTPGLTMSR